MLFPQLHPLTVVSLLLFTLPLVNMVLIGAAWKQGLAYRPSFSQKHASDIRFNRLIVFTSVPSVAFMSWLCVALVRSTERLSTMDTLAIAVAAVVPLALCFLLGKSMALPPPQSVTAA